MPSAPSRQNLRSARVGVAYALAAYIAWGLVPVYFKAVAHLPPLEVLAHRAVWSVVVLAFWMWMRGGLRPVLKVLEDRRTIVTLCGTTTLIAANWLTFIWAVAHNQVLQSSLGYFINPLVIVLLGLIFLHERLGRAQTVSVALAAAGVVYLTLGCGTLPWVALTLAGTFGFYALLRKITKADALTGLAVETCLLFPFALAYLGYLAVRGEGTFRSVSWQMDVLLALAGVVTAVPLLWFANAARRLRMATIGFLQYIGPSEQFLLAVFAFGETFTRDHLISFGCIWTALLIYSVDTARTQMVRSRNAQAAS